MQNTIYYTSAHIIIMAHINIRVLYFTRLGVRMKKKPKFDYFNTFYFCFHFHYFQKDFISRLSLCK